MKLSLGSLLNIVVSLTSRPYLLIVFFIFSKQLNAQSTTCKFATATFKNNLYSGINKNIAALKNKPLSPSTIDIWEEALWGMQLTNFKNAEYEKILKNNFSKILLPETDVLQRNYIEAINSLYPKNFGAILQSNISKLNNTKAIGIALMYLRNLGIKTSTQFINNKIKNDKTLDTTDINRLNVLLNEYSNNNKEKLPLQFISKDYLKGKTLVISFQRNNRQYPGIAVVRDTSGNFYTENGKIVGVPQLARAVTNSPYFITNGNTPQGLFVMLGYGESKNVYIGPTKNIQLKLPIEANFAEFSLSNTESDFTEEKYKLLLPQKLQNYKPVYQTYTAGKLGRNEIISHGTTINPEFYKGTTYYPQTPTAGCLCAIEIWDSNGKLIQSDQQKLIDIVQKSGGAYGYYLVVDIDNAQRPVTIADVLPYIQ